MKAHAWKACKRETVSRVRIPLSPPFFKDLAQLKIYNKMVWSSYGRQRMRKILLIIGLILAFSMPAKAERIIDLTNSQLKLNDKIGPRKFTINFFSGGRCQMVYWDLWTTKDNVCVWEQNGVDVNVEYFQNTNYMKFKINGTTVTGTSEYPPDGDGPDFFSGRFTKVQNYLASKPQTGSGSTSNPSKPKKSSGAAGTAFFITTNGHLITNYHVIEPCNNNSKIVHKTKETPVKIIAKDKMLDLALLKADLKRTDPIILSDEPPKKLQRIIAAGYPLGKSLSDDLKFTSGIVSSLKGLNDDSTLIQIDAALNRGNSGGPIVSEKTGELVGVAVSGLNKARTEAVNFGIKTNSLKNFLDSNQIKTPSSKILFGFGNADVSSILEDSTVYTYCRG